MDNRYLTIILLILLISNANAANITPVETPTPRLSDSSLRTQQQLEVFEITSRLDAIEKKIELSQEVRPGTGFEEMFEEQDKITQEKIDKLQTSLIFIIILLNIIEFALLGILRARGVV